MQEMLNNIKTEIDSLVDWMIEEPSATEERRRLVLLETKLKNVNAVVGLLFLWNCALSLALLLVALLI